MTIHMGITGTREGVRGKQRAKLWSELKKSANCQVCLHFGDCVGVDTQAFEMARALGFTTFAHPPINPKYRAWCSADVIAPPKPYMSRNYDIVQVATLLIVVPSGLEADNPRSGTWATYRMAVNAGVETVVIEP